MCVRRKVTSSGMCHKYEISKGPLVSCMLGVSSTVEGKMLCLERPITKRYRAW